MNPFGPGLWRAHRSSSVIGTVMQNVFGAQGPHGVFTEDSVTGGQELAVVAAKVELAAERASKLLLSVAIALHVAIAVALGSAAAAFLVVADEAVRPEPLSPVSHTFIAPSDTRVKVNRGQTFNVESNVLEFIVIVPDEAWKMDRPTATFQVSVVLLL